MAVLEDVMPFMVGISADVTNPARQYGADCGSLVKDYTDGVRVIDVVMDNLFKVIKSKRGQKPDCKKECTWGWLTAPSAYNFRVHNAQLLEETCDSGGLAARAAEAMETAHKVLRTNFRHSMSGANVLRGGHGQYYYVLRGVTLQKIAFLRSEAIFTAAVRERHSNCSGLGWV